MRKARLVPDSPGRSFGRKRDKFIRSAVPTALSFLLLSCIEPQTAQAQTYTWLGTTDGYWDVASNWSPNSVPTPGSTVINTSSSPIALEHRQNTDSIGSFSSTGLEPFLLSGGTLNVTNNFAINGSLVTSAGLLSAGSVNATSVYLNSGTLRVAGALTSTSNVTLQGGTLQNATITNPSLLAFSSNTGSVLDNVTLTGTSGLNVNGSVIGSTTVVRIANNIHYANGAIFNVGTNNVGNGSLFIDSTSSTPNVTLDNATINLGNSSGNYKGTLGFGNGFNSTGNTLTLGSGLTVQGTGNIGNGGTFTNVGANLVNNGTIMPSMASGALLVSTAANGSLTNNGTIQTPSGGTISMGTGSGGGTNLTGNVINNGMIRATSVSSITINTIGSGTIINNGTILASNGGNLTINGTLASFGLGTVTATGYNVLPGNASKVFINSALSLATQIGGLSESGGGVVYFQGNLNNVGNTFDVATLTGAGNSNGYLVLNGGRFSGGTINNANLLLFDISTNTVLDNVTLGGNSGLNVNSFSGIDTANVHIANAFNFANGAAFNVGTASTSTSYPGALYFDSTSGTANPTFDNATVNLGNANSYSYLAFGNGFNNTTNTLTLGSNLTIQGRGRIGSVDYIAAAGANLMNNGVINATYASGSIGYTMNVVTAAGGNITNNGTIQASAANSVVTVSPGSGGNLTNIGTIQATGSGSSVTLSTSDTGIITNNAAGTIAATNGSTVTASGNSFTNAGTLSIGSGSTLNLNSASSAQTAGTTLVNGTLSVSNSNSNTFTLSGGGLYGNGGTINGNLINTGGTVSAGMPDMLASIGTLTLNGNYMQGVNGIFSADIGGAIPGSQYDLFSIRNSAVLNGRLNINLLNNFTPTVGQSFQIISDSNGTTGSFSNVNNGLVADASGRFLFQIFYAATGVTLAYQGSDATPEPGTVTLLLSIGLPGGALALLRRRKK